MKYIMRVVIGLFLCGCFQAPRPVVHLQGETMGTTYNVKYVALPSSISSEKIHDAIDASLVKVNQQMSTYIPDSELMLLNSAPANSEITLSPQLVHVLLEAERLYELSNGLLDVTIGPLVNVWGFGPRAQREIVPSQDELNRALSLVGFDKVELTSTSVIKPSADTFIDLSTIAKGYGVDVVAEYLKSQGIQHFLVEIGGELRVAGRKPSGDSWRVAIEKPSASERGLQQIISVGDNAIATAGDYRNFFVNDGQRFSHLLDPTTGYPIRHFTASVTVVDSSSMTADGLATAFMIMAPDDAKRIARENNIPLYLIERVDDKLSVYYNDAFAQFLQK